MIKKISLAFLLLLSLACQPEGVTFEATVQQEGKTVPAANTEFWVVPDTNAQEAEQKQFRFTTDSQGKAKLELAEGKWLFTGEFPIRNEKVAWVMIPFAIDKDTHKIALTQENGFVVSAEASPPAEVPKRSILTLPSPGQ